MKIINTAFIFLLLLSCTGCKGQDKTKKHAAQNKSDMLIDNITKEERDPQMIL